MSASEEMMQEQLDRIIARAELRVEQWSIHASALVPYGDQAKRARSQLGVALMGLARLKKYRSRLAVVSTSRQPGPRSMASARARGGW